MNVIVFQHRQAAHCESGVTSNLLAHYGLALSEAMVWGVGGGLFFGHFPFIKVGLLDLTTFRQAPLHVFRSTCRRLGVRWRSRRFRDRSQSMRALDELLERGVPVGIQTGMQWLPYVPSQLQVPFNGHNLVVYGCQDGHYLLSDPMFDAPVPCSQTDLQRARFSQGKLAPRGLMYWVESVSSEPDLAHASRGGMRETVRTMLHAPLWMVGVRGIRYLARRARTKWPRDKDKARHHVAQLIPMQENTGTGGAGFRFMYAAFLQEASSLLGEARLWDTAQLMTEAGNRWRDMAAAGARWLKSRASPDESFVKMAHLLDQAADHEEAAYRQIEDWLGSSARSQVSRSPDG